ncbi:SDR family NAD(P)-dependent oxidoreductase [Paremcibacter congregatus]|uniref:Short-chain dehydrogenase n=1 Tax=Paremcibacter congregatus TaxID=2043170 RepID=A0A2G4YUU6_9PROT|nr:SDR family NAD(P)-dependent oxidoreductase [Paremcibacter congregatus]PHZ86095.1 short-chain dehydrogenase [Paremcibacter congregatus]QDE27061.1 SDR family NAD(P)-dependent oxidoreductase [Paremcibacter congregatus]
MKNPKSILITGGSSGLGEHLAKDYAGEDITLFLCGRNADRLDAVTKACEAKGAEVHSTLIDTADEIAMTAWITACDGICPLDLVIANAGIGPGFSPDQDLGAHTKQVFAVNLHGVFHTIHPALALMKERGRGQIALISSLAGYHGLPTAPAYSASKVAVKGYGEALRGLYAPFGVEINVVCPGFVKSRMTASNKFPMPFLMETEPAIKALRRGLEKNQARITFPWQLSLIFGFIVRFLPEWLFDRLFRVMPSKT